MKKLSEGDYSEAVYLQLLRRNLFTSGKLEAENGLLGALEFSQAMIEEVFERFLYC